MGGLAVLVVAVRWGLSVFLENTFDRTSLGRSLLSWRGAKMLFVYMATNFRSGFPGGGVVSATNGYT